MMKKAILYLFCYIVISTSLFNKAPLYANELIKSADIKQENTTAPATKLNMEKKLKSEIAEFLIIPFVIDKLYPEDEINKDFTPILQQIYQKTDKEKLKTYASYIRSFIKLKRRYDYVVASLKQQIKANLLLPKDAPIVAEDNEYAKAYEDIKKETPKDKYQITYTPYKYLEYDPNELGEPVRRRDKNYTPKVDNVDEITLALLTFDIKGFIKALKKLPRYNDGSAEKPNTLPSGLKARLLLNLAKPGHEETIRGVIQIAVPKDHYIIADTLNPNTRPRFSLTEDKEKTPSNIKNYQLFYPESAEVIKNNQTILLHIGTISYPISFERTDTYKPMAINATFSFILCDKNQNCAPQTIRHELTLNPSEEKELSIYHNHISQSFARLPKENARHANLQTTHYNSKDNTLTLTFNTTRPFNNIAVSIEDNNQNSYLTPKYLVNDTTITAIFNAPNLTKETTLSITALFDNEESLRKTISISPDTAPNDTLPPLFPEPPLYIAYLAGLFLPLFPLALFFLITLSQQIIIKKENLLNYAITTLISLTLLTLFIKQNTWNEIYEHTALIPVLTLIAVTAIAKIRYNLPLTPDTYLKTGTLAGFIIPAVLTVYPSELIIKTLSAIENATLTKIIAYTLALWLGTVTLPAFSLFIKKENKPLSTALNRLNLYYTVLIFFNLIWLTISQKGKTAAVILLTISIITYALWTLYPKVIAEIIKNTTTKQQEKKASAHFKQHALNIFGAITVITTLIIILIPTQKKQTVTPNIKTVIQTFEKTQTPTLVTVTADWSLTSKTNAKYLRRLQEKGINTIEIPLQGNDKTAKLWLNTYLKTTPPLNVLFTTLHPNGLKLPDELSNINFNEALKTYEPRKDDK